MTWSRRKWLFAIAFLVIAAGETSQERLAARTSTVSSAGGNVPAGVYEVVARHSGKCLDVSGVSTDGGAAAQPWSCHGGRNQLWRIEQVEADYSRLTAQHSGKCLDVPRRLHGKTERRYSSGAVTTETISSGCWNLCLPEMS